jgi:hypothetical protein
MYWYLGLGIVIGFLLSLPFRSTVHATILPENSMDENDETHTGNA